MSITLTDNSGDLNGLAINTDHEAKVALTQDVENSGFTSLVSEKGVFPNGTRIMRELEISEDYRLRTEQDTLFFTDQAAGTVINTSIWTSPISTMTVTLAQNAYILNAGNSVTAGHYAIHKTWRTFPMAYKGGAIYAECTMLYTAIPTTNHSIEGGLFNCTTTADPTDGVFFRLRDGNVYAVAVNSSVEQSVLISAAPTPNVETNLVIEATSTSVIFWMNNVPVAKIENSPATFSIQSQSQLPFQVRQFNGAVNPAYALQTKISNISVTLTGHDMSRLWPTARAGMGGGCYQIPSGAGSNGQTAAYANGAAPTTRTLSATTKMEVGLGGQAAFAAFAGVETDYNLFGYQVPANNTLIIRGLRIETANLGAAVTTTGTLLQWSIGIGSTADTLAGTESATVKVRRAIPLGFQNFPVSSPIGYTADPIDINLDAPVVIHGGEWFQIIFRQPVGSATASEVYRVLAMVNGYFE